MCVCMFGVSLCPGAALAGQGVCLVAERLACKREVEHYLCLFYDLCIHLHRVVGVSALILPVCSVPLSGCGVGAHW